jgi:hypothetical protein
MNNELKFERKRNKVENCPCGKSNRDGKFAPYVDCEKYGYCHSCGQTFLPPIEKMEQSQILPQKNETRPTKIERPISFFPNDFFRQSMDNYNENNFVQFLIDRFGVDNTIELVARYQIGTSKQWKGATIFWQIDQKERIRTGKIMLYNRTTGKRIKEPYNHVLAVKHPNENSNLKQCLFGEHLIQDNKQPIAIVESEKTAIISSYFFPKYIWLATGGKTQMRAEKMAVLRGRTVVLFPDLKAFDEWKQKAVEFSNIATFKVSDLLERKATSEDKQCSFDLADYLLKTHSQKVI